jgi:glutaredoxin
MFAASHLEVDHVDMAGKCNNWEEAAQFVKRLLDCNDNWVLSCKPCHKTKSLAERQGISFEEAQLQKKVIEFCKQKTTVVIDFLAQHQYNGSSVSNAAKRRKLVEQIFQGEMHARSEVGS